MTSPLYPNELVIDDDSHERHWSPTVNGFGTGWEKPDHVGYGAAAGEFPAELLLPWDEINRRAAEREASGNQLSHKIRRAGLKPSNQKQTNFCFTHAVVNNVRVLMMLANQKCPELSAASVACLVTNFRNIGGWARDPLNIIRERGVMPASLWPENAITRQYDTESNWKKAAPFKVDKWVTLEPGNLQQRASLNVQDIAVPVAYPWWGHEVLGCDYLPNGTFRDWNSWGEDWGDNGFVIIAGNKRNFSDGLACLSAAPGVAADSGRAA